MSCQDLLYFADYLIMDLYNILGLTVDCSDDDILKAFEIKTASFHGKDFQLFIDTYVAGKFLLNHQLRVDYNLFYYLRDERSISSFLCSKSELIECLLNEAKKYYNLPLKELLDSFNDRGLIYWKYKDSKKFFFFFKPLKVIYNIIMQLISIPLIAFLGFVKAWYIFSPIILIILLVKSCK